MSVVDPALAASFTDTDSLALVGPVEAQETLWASLAPSRKSIQGGKRWVVAGGKVRTLEAYAKLLADDESVDSIDALVELIEDIEDSDMRKNPESGEVYGTHAAAKKALEDYQAGKVTEADLKKAFEAMLNDIEDTKGDVHPDTDEQYLTHRRARQAVKRLVGARDVLVKLEAASKKKADKGLYELAPERRQKPPKGNEKEHYDALDDKPRHAVVQLKKALANGKIYQAKRVSQKDLEKEGVEYALSQWCDSAEHATETAEALNERRANKTPLPDSWPADKGPQAMTPADIKKHPGEYERLNKLRRDNTIYSKKDEVKP